MGGKTVSFLFLRLAGQLRKEATLLFREQSFFDFCCQNFTGAVIEG
jgi:hypothetical protein